MNRKGVFLLLILLFCNDSLIAMEEVRLKVHLPRKITVEGPEILLGDIAILYGSDEVRKHAAGIELSSFSAPGQVVTLDAVTIQSRLASEGYSSDQLALTGADVTEVSGKDVVITTKYFVQAAQECLEKKLSKDVFCNMKPIRDVEAFVLPAGLEEYSLQANLIGMINGRVHVEVLIIANEKHLGIRRLQFAVKYKQKIAVAKTTIPSGTLIEPEQVQIEEVYTSRSQGTDVRLPYGMVARREIEAGKTITPHLVQVPKPPLVVKRNQSVLIRVENNSLLVTASGQALQDGHVGALIKVRNVDSKRIIVAQVQKDGAVTPVF